MGYSIKPWTVEWLKAAFLAGVDLTDDDGNTFPTEMWEIGMNGAEGWIQRELSIGFPRQARTQRHDYTRSNLDAWSFISLDHRPVREVTQIRMQYGTFEIFTVPGTWLIQEDDGIQLQILPAGGQPVAAPLELIGFASYWLATLGQNVPGFFVIEYDAGHDLPLIDGDPATPPDYDPLPGDILELMGKKACCMALDTAGDLVAGRATASFSVGMDGLSYSKSTTASATNAGLGARIIQHRKWIKEQLPMIRRSYQGMQIGVA